MLSLSASSLRISSHPSDTSSNLYQIEQGKSGEGLGEGTLPAKYSGGGNHTSDCLQLRNGLPVRHTYLSHIFPAHTPLASRMPPCSLWGCRVRRRRSSPPQPWACEGWGTCRATAGLLITDLRSSASTLGVRKLLVTAYGMQVVHGHDARARAFRKQGAILLDHLVPRWCTNSSDDSWHVYVIPRSYVAFGYCLTGSVCLRM